MNSRGAAGSLDADGPRCFAPPSPKAFTVERAGTSLPGPDCTSHENRLSHPRASAAARSLARPLLRTGVGGGRRSSGQWVGLAVVGAAIAIGGACGGAGGEEARQAVQGGVGGGAG